MAPPGRGTRRSVMGPSGLRSGRPAAAGSAAQKLAFPPGLAHPRAPRASADAEAPKNPVLVRATRKKPGDDASGTTCGSSAALRAAVAASAASAASSVVLAAACAAVRAAFLATASFSTCFSF